MKDLIALLTRRLAIAKGVDRLTTMNGEPLPCEDKKKLYDFYENYNGTIPGMIISQEEMPSDSNAPKKPTDARKEVNPKDVYDELSRIDCPFDLDEESINNKIDLLKRKIELGDDQRYTKKQMEGMIDCLQYRKQYKEHEGFFSKFGYTNQEKIDNLLKEYKLSMQKSTLFIPEFPESAVKIMEMYSEHVDAITGKKPVFYVIAKPETFKKKYEKHDPILLVQSPFGFCWQILGAWDDELTVLEEL